jgi:hypothetical protein
LTVLALGACESSSDGRTSASERYCARVAEIGALDVLADPAPAAVRRDLEHLLVLTRRAAQVAPGAIRADAMAAARAQARFNRLYARHGWRPQPTITDPEFIAFAANPALAATSLRLERYQLRTCDDTTRTTPRSVAPA